MDPISVLSLAYGSTQEQHGKLQDLLSEPLSGTWCPSPQVALLRKSGLGAASMIDLRQESLHGKSSHELLRKSRDLGSLSAKDLRHTSRRSKSRSRTSSDQGRRKVGDIDDLLLQRLTSGKYGKSSRQSSGGLTRSSGSGNRLSSNSLDGQEQRRRKSSRELEYHDEKRERSQSRGRRSASRRRERGSHGDLKELGSSSSHRPRSSGSHGDLKELGSSSTHRPRRGGSRNDLKALGSTSSHRPSSSGNLRENRPPSSSRLSSSSNHKTSTDSIDSKMPGPFERRSNNGKLTRPRSSSRLSDSSSSSHHKTDSDKDQKSRSSRSGTSKSLSPTRPPSSSARGQPSSSRGQPSSRGQQETSPPPKSSSSPLSPHTPKASSVMKQKHLANHRNGVLALLEAEYRKHQEEKALDVKCQELRTQLHQAKERWVKVMLEKDADLRGLQARFEAEKNLVREQITNAFHKRQKAVAALTNEELELEKQQEIMELHAEQVELKTELAELSTNITALAKENRQLEQANIELEANFVNLTQWCLKKTAQQKKLQAAHDRIETIYRGSVALQVEPQLKNLYREHMYKVGRGVQMAFDYDDELDSSVWKQIRSCESDLGCNVLEENTGTEAWTTQQAQMNDCHAIPATSSLSNMPYGGEEDNDLIPTDVDYDNVDVEKFTADANKASSAYFNLSGVVDATQMSTLYENRDMMITIFRFLDKDGGGTISREEFRMGIDLLNRRLPAAARFQDSDELFQALDVDRSGEIDLDEFEGFFAQNANITEETYEWGVTLFALPGKTN